MMIKLLIFVIFDLMEYINCCAIMTDRPLTEELKKNLRSPWLVLIIDETIRSPIGICYGALIKENTVLTSAKAVFNHDVDNLLAVTDCMIAEMDKKVNSESCVSRKSVGIYPNDVYKDDIRDSDVVVLLLKEPFELTNRISTIPMINEDNIDDIDKSNCLVYHWVFEFDGIDRVPITVQYRLVPDEGGFKIDENEEKKLISDGDCFLDPCPYFLTIGNYTAYDVSFLGSPIACSLKNDPNQYVQTGLAMIVYRVYHSLNENASDKYEILEGSLYDLSPQRNSIK